MMKKIKCTCELDIDRRARARRCMCAIANICVWRVQRGQINIPISSLFHNVRTILLLFFASSPFHRCDSNKESVMPQSDDGNYDSKWINKIIFDLTWILLLLLLLFACFRFDYNCESVKFKFYTIAPIWCCCFFFRCVFHWNLQFICMYVCSIIRARTSCFMHFTTLLEEPEIYIFDYAYTVEHWASERERVWCMWPKWKLERNEWRKIMCTAFISPQFISHEMLHFKCLAFWYKLPGEIFQTKLNRLTYSIEFQIRLLN